MGSHLGLSDPRRLFTTKPFLVSCPFPASSNVPFLPPGLYGHSRGEKEQRSRGGRCGGVGGRLGGDRARGRCFLIMKKSFDLFMFI